MPFLTLIRSRTFARPGQGRRQIALLVALTLSGLAVRAEAQTSGWSTVVEPAPSLIAPAPSRHFDTELPMVLEREGLTLRVEGDLGAAPAAETDRFLVVRRGLAPDVEGGPYIGAGFGLDDAPGGEAAVAGKLVGGVAAPFSEAVQVYGEYQHQRGLESGGGDDRLQFGLRRKF